MRLVNLQKRPPMQNFCNLSTAQTPLPSAIGALPAKPNRWTYSYLVDNLFVIIF